MSHFLRGTAAASALLCALGAAGTAQAAGFQLKEQSAEGAGHAFAGMTAKADDYDTIFYNPAGMTRLKTGMGGHASYIAPVAEFDDGGSSGSTPTGVPAPNMGTETSGDAIKDAVIPALYGLWKVNPDLAVGVAVNIPYGLKTDYDDAWIGRYHALKSDLETISLQPAIAYRVTPRLSLGAGLNVQHASAELTKAVDFTTIDTIATASPAVGSTGLNGDGYSKVEGDDTSTGFTLSALFELSDQTRVGAHYRSRVHHTLDGDLKFSNKPTFIDNTGGAVPAAAATVNSLNGTFANGDATAKLTTPDSANLGIYHQFNDEVALMADVAWTNWSQFRTLTIVRDNGVIASQKEENWKDAWFFSLGGSYSPTSLPDWTFNAGVAYDQSPVRDAYRTPRVPDNDRTWLSLGASYRPMENLELEMGYTHIFVDTARIDDTESNATLGYSHTLQGSYDSHVDIVAFGATYRF